MKDRTRRAEPSSERLQLGRAEDCVESFAIDHRSVVPSEIDRTWQIVVLIALVSLQKAEFDMVLIHATLAHGASIFRQNYVDIWAVGGREVGEAQICSTVGSLIDGGAAGGLMYLPFQSPCI